MDDDLTLLQLIQLEQDPEMRKVLEQYRGAEIELNAASEQLAKMGRHKWSHAAESRARDVAWQAQRYMRIERQRDLKLHDFMDDAPTNPSARYSGMAERLEPGEVISTDQAVMDLPPSSSWPPPRTAAWPMWAFTAAVFLVIVLSLWLMRGAP